MSFTFVDLFAATVNAFNGGLLAQRPDHYRRNYFTLIGVQKGLEAELPVIAGIFLGVVGPTAGRYLIDVTCGLSAKQFVRGEWFVGTAVLTSVAFYVLKAPNLLDLSFTAATLIAFAIGFTFRLAAIWWAWEEPMARVPARLLEGEPERERLKDKMKPEWEPDLG